MNIKIKNCEECPFYQIDYDEWACGDDTLIYCGLAKFLNKEYIIISLDSKEDSTIECDYCKNHDWDSNVEFDESKCECYTEKANSPNPSICPLKEESFIIEKDEDTSLA